MFFCWFYLHFVNLSLEWFAQTYLSILFAYLNFPSLRSHPFSTWSASLHRTLMQYWASEIDRLCFMKISGFLAQFVYHHEILVVSLVLELLRWLSHLEDSWHPRHSSKVTLLPCNGFFCGGLVSFVWHIGANNSTRTFSVELFSPSFSVLQSAWVRLRSGRLPCL